MKFLWFHSWLHETKKSFGFSFVEVLLQIHTQFHLKLLVLNFKRERFNNVILNEVFMKIAHRIYENFV